MTPEIEAALMDATNALLAMRMGARDEDFELIRDAAANLTRAAEKAHRLAFNLARNHSREL